MNGGRCSNCKVTIGSALQDIKKSEEKHTENEVFPNEMQNNRGKQNSRFCIRFRRCCIIVEEEIMGSFHRSEYEIQ